METGTGRSHHREYQTEWGRTTTLDIVFYLPFGAHCVVHYGNRSCLRMERGGRAVRHVEAIRGVARLREDPRGPQPYELQMPTTALFRSIA